MIALSICYTINRLYTNSVYNSQILFEVKRSFDMSTKAKKVIAGIIAIILVIAMVVPMALSFL